MRPLLVTLSALILPATAFAAPATFWFGNPTEGALPGNTYVTGGAVVLTTPVGGDLAALAGTIVAASPVGGDEMVVGGSVTVRGAVRGDLRAIGGSVTIGERVGGDLVVLGYDVNIRTRPSGSSFVGGLKVSFEEGGVGDVSIYGNDVTLAGTFEGDVEIVASGRVRLNPGTHIKGRLLYEAPEPTELTEVSVDGGVTYESSSYLPSVSTIHVLAPIGVAVFLLVRILGALILAGLLAGLFPRPAERITGELRERSITRSLLMVALGFGVTVALPVLIILLAITFVGLGISLLLLFSYILLLMLSFMYTAIVAGSLIARRISGRVEVLWREGVTGMLLIAAVALIPFAGPIIVVFSTMYTVGALTILFFRFAFPKEATQELL